jgi:hypothetical protein
MTFFSSAARIWSQGLSAEVGVVANAIVQSLPIPPALRRAVRLLNFRQRLLPRAMQIALRLLSGGHQPVYYWSAPKDLTPGLSSKVRTAERSRFDAKFQERSR